MWAIRYDTKITHKGNNLHSMMFIHFRFMTLSHDAIKLFIMIFQSVIRIQSSVC